jgi:uncharacterized membrane protein
MDDFVTIYYWIRVAVLVAVTLLSLGSALRMSARRPYKPWREVAFAVLAVVLFIALSGIVGVTFGPLWAGMLALVGLLVGFLVHRDPKVASEGGRVMLRRSPVVPWVWFVAVVLVAATLLFAESYTFALSMLLLAFAAGLVVGETIALLMKVKAAPATMPAPAPTPEAGTA